MKKVITKADYIRQASDEQLAEYIYLHDDNLNDIICEQAHSECPFGDTVQPSDCKNCVKEWLQNPVEEGKPWYE